MAIAYPEAVCIRAQMERALVGKEIAGVSVVDITTHGGPWRYGAIEQAPAAFEEGLVGYSLIGVDQVANTVFLETSGSCYLGIGYISGKVTYHQPEEELPKKSCLRVQFADDSHLCVVISMWGLVRVLGEGERPAYVARWYGQGIEPLSGRFFLDGFREAIAHVKEPKLTAKKFLHAFEPGYYLSGIDSGYAIEILHRAGIHPKRLLVSLSAEEQKACYHSVNTVAEEAVNGGGRHSEFDLYGNRGGFLPHVCRARLGQPCLECGTPIVKFRFEGGSSYACPTCQPL